jgi:hypothetical protein
MIDYRKLIGGLLSLLVLLSALLAVLQIWGLIGEDVAWQLIGTFCVTFVAAWGLSLVADSFFGKLKS